MFANSLAFSPGDVVAVVFSLIALVCGISAFIKAHACRKMTTSLCAGKKGAALEEIILENNEKLREFDAEIHELFDISNTVHKQANKGLHKIGLVRFNPFRDYSGNQSFALALLNGKGSGVILSSIHTRESTRIYTKEIKNGSPVKNELTAEEKEALSIAR